MPLFPQPLEADKCFEKIPHSALSLQLAAYYYAVQVAARIQPTKAAKESAIYGVAPPSLIQKVLKHSEGRRRRAGRTRRGRCWGD